MNINFLLLCTNLVTTSIFAGEGLPFTEEEIEAAKNLKPVYPPKNATIPYGSPPRMTNRNYVADRSYRWPNKEIPYTIDAVFNAQNAFDSTTTDRITILNAMMLIENAGCTKFRPKNDNDTAWVSIVNQGKGGCWAHVGYYGPTVVTIINLEQSKNCVATSVIVHEMLHTHGTFHEQSRPDRNDWVTINWSNIETSPLQYHNFFRNPDASLAGTAPICEESATTTNYDNCVAGPVVDLFGLPYDINSIMHYGLELFSSNGQSTIQPKDPSITSAGSDDMTTLDIEKLRIAYQCGAPTTPTTTTTTKNTPITTSPTTTTKIITTPITTTPIKITDTSTKTTATKTTATPTTNTTITAMTTIFTPATNSSTKPTTTTSTTTTTTNRTTTKTTTNKTTTKTTTIKTTTTKSTTTTKITTRITVTKTTKTTASTATTPVTTPFNTRLLTTKHLWIANATSMFRNQNYAPKWAIDGIVCKTNSKFWSSAADNYAWLQVTLEQTYSVVQVKVQDRLDCCFVRYNDVEVRVGETDVSTVTAKFTPISVNAPCGHPQTYNNNKVTQYTYTCEPITGKYISVQRLAKPKDYWHINEIDVYVVDE